jgi:hypothetical protein
MVPSNISIPSKKNKNKIIDSLWTFLIALAVLGPFALPLLWRNPRWTLRVKIAGSAVIVIVTFFLLWFTRVFVADLNEKYQELKSAQESSTSN